MVAPRVFVGVDIGKASHYAVGIDEAGETVHRRAVDNAEGSLGELVRWAVEHEAALVVDQPGGTAALLLRLCWSAGVAVGYLHGTAMARARDFYAGEGKTDPKDAFVLADVARAHPRRVVWLEPTDDARARLELLCGYDADLRADANRLTNRLRALLGTHWPALERALGERLDTRPVLGVLQKYPSGPALARAGATRVSVSRDEAERLRFWSGRKAAFPAVGRISPDYYCMDGTIPRKELPRVLAGMRELSEKYGLRVANVFHAGDGNLHPLILYDANVPGELDKAESFGADILRLCVKVGGVLTGEHGVGVEKRDLMPEMFNQIDLDQQMRVKCAFDPNHLLNPGKVFPQLRRCAELGRMHVHRGQTAFPDIPRF
jgi:hypothetical protein